eukprot:14644390-Heterocapsa_arctica.AAC.1
MARRLTAAVSRPIARPLLAARADRLVCVALRSAYVLATMFLEHVAPCCLPCEWCGSPTGNRREAAAICTICDDDVSDDDLFYPSASFTASAR